MMFLRFMLHGKINFNANQGTTQHRRRENSSILASIFRYNDISWRPKGTLLLENEGLEGFRLRVRHGVRPGKNAMILEVL